jgi:hypothetical protein
MSLPLLVRPANRAIDLPIASLSLRPTGVITPTTHRRLPFDKPSRHALSVQQPCFQPCLACAHSVSNSEASARAKASKAEPLLNGQHAMDQFS